MSHRRAILIASIVFGIAPAGKSFAGDLAPVRAVVEQYCVSCHDADEPEAGFDLASLAPGDVKDQPEAWEKVVRRLRGRQMPPAGKPRPTEQVYASIQSSL